MGRAAAYPEQAAIAAVAREFTADWNGRYLVLDGRLIALEIVALGQKAARDDSVRPRLRFDRVVLRLFADLRAAVSDVIAQDQAVIVTVTAPVRMGGKTAEAIADRIRGGHRRGDVNATIHGNQVQLRRIARVPKQMPKLIGFVHNPETDPGPILNLMQAMLRGIGEAMLQRKAGSATRERWLILSNPNGHLHADTYRRIWEQIAIPSGFAKILVVLPGGKVADLTT
jgi:hypothetical protein